MSRREPLGDDDGRQLATSILQHLARTHSLGHWSLVTRAFGVRACVRACQSVRAPPRVCTTMLFPMNSAALNPAPSVPSSVVTAHGIFAFVQPTMCVRPVRAASHPATAVCPHTAPSGPDPQRCTLNGDAMRWWTHIANANYIL